MAGTGVPGLATSLVKGSLTFHFQNAGPCTRNAQRPVHGGVGNRCRHVHQAFIVEKPIRTACTSHSRSVRVGAARHTTGTCTTGICLSFHANAATDRSPIVGEGNGPCGIFDDVAWMNSKRWQEHSEAGAAERGHRGQ